MSCDVSVLVGIVVCFVFKQKTAYEMRISDWSSDVCSSDLYLAPSAEFDTMARFWGSPIEGLCFHVDVTNMKVLRVIDTGIYPIPTESGEIHKPEALPEPRQGLKPIQITQPEGVSFHPELGRAASRERGCRYGVHWGGA